MDSHWPAGFRCPRCDGNRYLPRKSRPSLECASCSREVSVTAVTTMHRTRTRLQSWFWAAYLVTATSTGTSAASLQRQLGLARYETASMMLHRLRKAMVNAERTKLRAEVDEFALGGFERGRVGGRQKGKAVRCIITDNVEAGAVVRTDGWPAYRRIAVHGYEHRPRSQLKVKREGDTESVMPRAHQAISNLKAWHHGTHRWVSPEHTQAYLDEYVFRHIRRSHPRPPSGGSSWAWAPSTSPSPERRSWPKDRAH
ncbi:MAG: transposase [Yaniella sp.]|nr:transposase [Yaniella sp.]